MQRPDYLPADYNRIKVAGSLQEFFTAAAAGCQGGFGVETNAVLLPRKLAGAFNSLAWTLAERMGVEAGRFHALGPLAVKNMRLSGLRKEEEEAFHHIRKDVENVVASGLAVPHLTELRIIRGYDNGTVLNFHPDGTSRILCAYNDPVTEWVRNEDLEGPVNGLRPRNGAPVYSFRAGDLWAQYGDLDDKPNSFFHKAVNAPAGQARLLLVVGTPYYPKARGPA